MTSLNIIHVLKCVLLCGFWYGTASTSAILGKTILSGYKFEHPMTLTFAHLLSSSLLSIPLIQFMGLKQGFRSESPGQFFKFLIPICIGKILATLASHVAIWRMSVSFVHTVKSSVPIFTVALCWLIYKETQRIRVYVTLIPIVGGVALATTTEISFEVFGFIAALTATIGFSLQNIFNKKFMALTQIHPFELMALLSRTSFIILLPIWAAFDLKNILSQYEEDCGGDVFPYRVIVFLAFDGFLNFIQNIIAFWVLSLISAPSYGVAAGIKRVSIIVSSALIFQNKMSWLNVIGISITILGVSLYSYFRNLDKQSKESKEEEGGDGESNQKSSSIETMI